MGYIMPRISQLVWGRDMGEHYKGFPEEVMSALRSRKMTGN